ncbi:MAG: IS701 family transposase [Deltaproteobacteria bacterium]|nr:IS701 family transposase [Deltaproteobacteria bacterium]
MDERSDRSVRFDEYLDRLSVAVGGKSRRRGPLGAYCTGLLIPGERKSMEPMAARLDPTRVQAMHQSLQNFVSQAAWCDEAVLTAAREYALPVMEEHGSIEAWLVDDTGYPKQGKHSVGVARQYCGMLGKTMNCQAAVTTFVANESASLPVAHRLYLPEKWAADPERRKKAGVSDSVQFRTKWEIALDQVEWMMKAGIPDGVVGADAGYGDVTAFRDGLTKLGRAYVVGIRKGIAVWGPGKGPAPAPEYPGRGRPATRLRRDKDHKPESVLKPATALPPEAWQQVNWREGTQGEMSSRFARVRVWAAHLDDRRTEPPPTEWLLIEWPESEPEPTKHWLSTLPEDTDITTLVRLAKLRWRIERDYEELKQEVGFAHFEGRGWRGFHHHAALSIAAYAFLVAERARLSPPRASGTSPFKAAPLPSGFRPRGSADPA